MNRVISLFFVLIISFPGFAQKKVVFTPEQIADAQNDSSVPKQLGVEYFLKNFFDISSLPKYENDTYCAEVSTYDRTGMNNDGFDGTYSFIRRKADSTLVLFEQKGPGIINRIWTPTPTEDTLVFFIDDTLTPAFSIRYIDLFSGKIFPFIAPLCANQLGGYFCYLPIPFNKFCRIEMKAKKTMFHQVGYQLYPTATVMKSFSVKLGEEEKAALEMISGTWSRQPMSVKNIYNKTALVSELNRSVTIKPGQTITLFQAATGGRIAGFELISPAVLDILAKNIDIRITWDGEKSPAINCPLADYFGYSFGKASMNGLLAGSDGKRHYSYFPMPYDRSAKIELIYRPVAAGKAPESVNLQTKFFVQPKKRNAATEGKFYATWNNEDPVPAGKPYTMLDAKGKGHFVGVALQAQGLLHGITGFFEGDDSTVIDGEMRFHGTGSEDFFNGGWYALLDRWDDAMSLPLSGCLDYSLPLSRTGGYRFFINDKMSFDHSIYQSIEHGPENNQWPSNYTSVSYYYCDRLNIQKAIPSNNNTKIYTPDTLEIYPQLTYTAMDENMAAEAKWDGTPAKTMFYTISNESLLKMYLQDVPPGDYEIYFDYRKGKDAAQFSTWQRQTQLSEWIDAYAASKEKVEMQKIGNITVTELNNSLSLRFKTTAERNKFSLTRIFLVRKNKSW